MTRIEELEKGIEEIEKNVPFIPKGEFKLSENFMNKIIPSADLEIFIFYHQLKRELLGIKEGRQETLAEVEKFIQERTLIRTSRLDETHEIKYIKFFPFEWEELKSKLEKMKT